LGDTTRPAPGNDGFGSSTGACQLGMGGRDVNLHAIVQLERGEGALAVQTVLSCLLHVGVVGKREAMECGDGDADG
jgi:hypothetical protein